MKAWKEIVAAGESVSAWKVCQSAVLKLKVDSWSSLGFQMQEVPSLHKLMVTETKVLCLSMEDTLFFVNFLFLVNFL